MEDVIGVIGILTAVNLVGMFVAILSLVPRCQVIEKRVDNIGERLETQCGHWDRLVTGHCELVGKVERVRMDHDRRIDEAHKDADKANDRIDRLINSVGMIVDEEVGRE